MKILRVILISSFLFILCLVENYLNTFISLDFGVYIFLISLIYIGTEAFNQNLLLVPASENVVRILPPLNITKKEIDQALKIINKVCTELK